MNENEKRKRVNKLMNELSFSTRESDNGTVTIVPPDFDFESKIGQKEQLTDIAAIPCIKNGAGTIKIVPVPETDLTAEYAEKVEEFISLTKEIAPERVEEFFYDYAIPVGKDGFIGLLVFRIKK